MNQTSITLSEHEMVAVGRPALMSLRTALLRDGDPNAPVILREAGYAGGERLWSGFTSWCAAQGLGGADELELDSFREAASRYFREIGWGSFEITVRDDAVVMLDSPNWWEAESEGTAAEPGCHFTTGLLAYFFRRVAEAPLAVLEVECRSAGGDQCRFLLGAPDVLRYVFDELERGGTWEGAVDRL